MRIFRYIGIIVCLGVVLVGIQFRGAIRTSIAEQVAKRRLPRAVNVSEVKDLPAMAGRLPTFVGDPSTPLRSAQGDNYVGLPLEFNLAVPFTSQAPFAVWDAIHEDACEEASVIMVDAFYKNKRLTAKSADEEILSTVEWETNTFGYWKDTTIEETARILREKYGYKNVRVVYDPSLDDIKREILKGHPVIIPAAGQLLYNRYFHQPGPLYHMLVVRGWLKNGDIITNDPGTKRGEGYIYRPEILMSAIHDWNNGDVIHGRKAMLIVEN